MWVPRTLASLKVDIWCFIGGVKLPAQLMLPPWELAAADSED